MRNVVYRGPLWLAAGCLTSGIRLNQPRKAILMDQARYNCSEFVASPNEFLEFAEQAPKATMRAPSFPLEDLATGETVDMKDLWSTGVTVMEFGSFT